MDDNQLEQVKRLTARTTAKSDRWQAPKTGTAFLITQTYALTCAHCLGSVQDWVPNVTLEFSRWGITGAILTATVEEEPDWDNDVAVLKITSLLPSEVVLLTLVRSCAKGEQWETFAYPTPVGTSGIVLGGAVMDPDALLPRKSLDQRYPAMQLHCSQGQDSLRGTSGAPVVVRGSIVGILNNQLVVEQPTPYGIDTPIYEPTYDTVYALPLNAIQEKLVRLCTDLKTLLQYPPASTLQDRTSVQLSMRHQLPDPVLAFVGRETTDRAADRFQKDLEKIISSTRKYPKELVDSEILKQLSILRRARFFVGFSIAEQSIRLAEKIFDGEFEGGSDTVKSTALAWCARFLAIGEDSAKSDHFLNRARQLGDGPEITVAEAFRLSASGNFAEALSKLAAIVSPNARSAAFLIVVSHRHAAAAIHWLTESGISHTDLDADGKFILITKLFELCRWETALEHVKALQEEDYQFAPVLFHTAAMAHLVQAIPNERKSFVLQQVPFEAYTFPLAANEASLRSRRIAQDLFHKCAASTRELGCVEIANLAEDYALWLELRDPEGRISGREKLQKSMRDPIHALRRLYLAIQFGIELDLSTVEREIDQQTAISGGKSRDAAIARLSLAHTKGSPKEVAAYIDRHRNQLQAHLGKKSLSVFEVEMLARAGLPPQAEERLRSLITDGISEVEQNHLRRIIAEATGTDPVEARKTQFQSSGQLHDLENLVRLLEEQNDWPQLCHYGGLLFETTLALVDAERFARALYQEQRYSDLIALLRKYPEFLDQSDNLQMLWSWSLFREGSLAESSAALKKLMVKRDHTSDRDLQVNLAITSGAWETLQPIIEKEWEHREDREARDLIRTAQLAQSVGSPRTKDFVCAAAKKGANDASILAAAYFLASHAGWEDDATVAAWLHSAAQLSGNEGPLKKMSLKDLVDQTPEWNRRETETWQQVSEGTLPLFVAARLLNKSLVDIVLLPVLANPREPDPRKRALIPAYSGVRQTVQSKPRTVAVDVTTLLTLSVLGLLNTIGESFEHIVISHSTLGWLFEEKQKVFFHQPSRIKVATELRQLLAVGTLKTFTERDDIDPDLATEVGKELASLIAEARTIDGTDERQKIVIRSSPVYRVNSLTEEEADLSAYSSLLGSCLAVVNKLKQKGQLTTAEELRARSYLCLHEKEWPHQPEIADGAMLYLNALTVTYLQHTSLLEKLRLAGLEAYISTREIEEINGLLRYEQLASGVSGTIESIRGFLAAGIQTGKVKLGRKSHLDGTEEISLQHHPTFALFHLDQDVEAIVVDDRCLNQHRNVDNSSSLVPILTTLDLLDALHSSDVITFDRMMASRTTLRRAGYLFVPVTASELEYYLSTADVVDGKLNETAELKAIRENLLRIRMSQVLQLPKETFWFTGIIHTFVSILKAQWRPEVTIEIARARSEWLLRLLDPRGWAHCFKGEGNARMMTYSYGSQVVLLLMAPLNIPTEIREKYWEWLDEQVLTEIREEVPDLYAWIIERTKAHIVNVVDRNSAKESA